MAERARLHPDDCEAIARRVAELLREEPAGPAAPDVAQLLTAQEVADRFGLSRDWVYEHKTRLGAIPLSEGRRPRLRFDPQRVAEALAAGKEPSPPPERPPARRRGARPAATAPAADLLPIRGRRA